MAEQDQTPKVEATTAPAATSGESTVAPASAPSATARSGQPAASGSTGERSGPRGEQRFGQRGGGRFGQRGGGQRGGPGGGQRFGQRGGQRGGPGGGRGRGGPRDRRRQDEGPQDGLEEKVLFINRSSKVVKGGRRFNFSALVAVGDRQGKVGLGLGKAREVVEAIRKGSEDARANMEKVALLDATIPHEVLVDYDGARVLLRPASPGTGVIAGKTVRAVLELAGLRDVLSKSLGSNNAANVAKATFVGLQQLRLRTEIYQLRGLPLEKGASEQPATT